MKSSTTICPACNGSGEGMYDGHTCRACGGAGEFVDEEEEEPEYEHEDD